MERTDKERIDYLGSLRRVTLWVGVDFPDGHMVWPVSPNSDIRLEIDRAMEIAQRTKAKIP